MPLYFVNLEIFIFIFWLYKHEKLHYFSGNMDANGISKNMDANV